MINISLLVTLSCVNKYLCVPVLADTEVSYYAPQEVGNITIGDMVISLQNASGFTITDESYINAIKNNMSGSDQDIDHIMAMSEGDAVQYLNVCINNAESAGATKLSNSLSISNDMASYLNQQNPNAGVVAQNGGELLYESIKETYQQNTENDDILSRSRAVMQGALKRVASGVAQSPQDLARLTITGLAGTMFGIPGAVAAGLQTGLFSNNVKAGAPINIDEQILNNIPNGGGFIMGKYDNSYQQQYVYTFPDGVFPYAYVDEGVSENSIVYGIFNVSGETISYKKSYYAQGEHKYTQDKTLGDKGQNQETQRESITTIIPSSSIMSKAQFMTIRDNYSNGGNKPTNATPVSPDVISNQGNVNYDPDTQTINITQSYDPADNYFLPIKIGSDSYGDYITNLNNNTTNNDYSQNGDVYNNYITNNYITNAPPVPTPTPTPIIPPQPDIPTVPSIDGLPEEVVQELTDNMVPDLSAFFPFCIPFDIMAIASAFSSDNREPIVLDFDLNLSIVGIYHIHVDLSPWDEVASLARALELALFILGLAQYARSIDAVGL